MAGKRTQYTIFASAARTTTPISEVFPSANSIGIVVVIDVTSVTLTPLVTPRIQGKDKVSGKFYDILVGAVISATGTVELRVYPGMTAVTNLVADDFLPTEFRVTMSHGDADSITYSVGAELVG